MTTTTEATDFESELAARGMRGFWSMLDEYEMKEPRNAEKAEVWTYREYAPLAHRALEEVDIRVADRRNIFFSNPGLDGAGTITARLLGGVQAINAGEISTVHRHSASAARVHLEGDGAYTTVEGGKCNLEVGDLVINPHGLWHETGNLGDKPVIWMDVLDLAFTRTLNANFFSTAYSEVGADGTVAQLANQTLTSPADWPATAFGTAGGVRPADSAPVGRGLGSAQLLYKYRPARELLDRLLAVAPESTGIVTAEYYDPMTGGPVLRTIDARLHLLRAGGTTDPARTTAGTIYVCLEGGGATVVDGKRLEWGPKDIFVVPGWAEAHHENGAAESVLCAISDAPALSQLGLLMTRTSHHQPFESVSRAV